MGKSSGAIWVSLGLKTDKFSKGISTAKGKLSGFQKGVGKLKNAFSPLTLGFAAASAGAFAIGAAFVNAIGTINKFEKANSDLQAVLGESGTQGVMKSLSDQAKELGASTAFTATEVAGLQKEFAKLGFDPSQIKNMTEATLNLAAAAGVELSEAARVAGSTINAFGLNSQDAQKVTDVMALSFSKSALDMEKFSETMKNAAPIARATGVSLEMATAAAGKLADANITGSKAGTDLKKIFSELVKDGKPFAASLEDIAKKMNDASSPAEKLGIAEKLVGDRAKGALLVLVEQKDALGELSTALDQADGDAKAMADTMLDNVQGSLTKATSAYEGLILSVEDGSGVISNAVKGLIDDFTGFLSLMTKINSGSVSFEDQWKIALNGITKGFFMMLKPLQMVLAGVDKLAGTDMASFLDAPQLDLAMSKVSALDNAIGKLTETQIASKRVQLAKEYMKAGLSAEEATKKIFNLQQSFKRTAEVMPEVKAEFNGVSEGMKKTAKSAKKTQDNIDAYARSLMTANDAELGFGGDIFAETDLALEAMQMKLNDVPLKISIRPELEPIPEEETEALRLQGEQIQANANAIGGSVSNAFASMADGMVESMGFADSASGRFAKSLASTALKLIATNLATAMANAISGATASGSATGPAAAVATPTFIASAIAGIIGAFASIPKFAKGVTNFGGGAALVGELGPELVNLPRGSDVIPNKDLTSGGGAMDIKISGELMLKGSTLVAALKRENKVNTFSG